MVFKKNKQGQAAIEFLMTYGWMLLVVLIVGALIFSFVDFGSLLPNKIELNNNLRASATESAAYANYTDSGAEGDVVLVFTYNGAKRVEITAVSGTIMPSTGNSCTSDEIRNVDTSQTGTGTEALTFLNGQTGVMIFDCTDQLISGDVIEGSIKIDVTSTKTNLNTPSSGPIRLAIN